MNTLILTTVVLVMVILLLLGIIAFLLTMLQIANREHETWAKPVEPPDIDWDKWDYIKGAGWREDRTDVKEARDNCRV